MKIIYEVNFLWETEKINPTPGSVYLHGLLVLALLGQVHRGEPQVIPAVLPDGKI